MPAAAFTGVSDESIGTVFSFYATPILFPLRLPTGFTENDTQTFVVDSSVIGAKLVIDRKVSNLRQPVRISLISFRATENLVRTSSQCCNMCFVVLQM